MNNEESPVICDMIDDIRIYGLLQKHCYVMSPKERRESSWKDLSSSDSPVSV